MKHYTISRISSMLLILLGILFLAQGVFATVVLSNLASPFTGWHCFTPWIRGKGFTTDAGGPYVLNSVTLQLDTTSSTVTASLYNDNAGSPGTAIGTIATYTGTGGAVAFNATSSFTLNANATYWIVVDGSAFDCIWHLTNTAPSGQFTYVNSLWSSDGGTTWNTDAHARMEIDVSPVTSIVDAGDDSPQQVFFDDRINDFDTGNSVVLYGKANGDDEWRLEVYNADSSGMLLVIYPETIAAVPECPDSNTLIYSDEATGISLWRLPQRTVTIEGFSVCPFQLNAPSTEAGKTYIIIFDTLYPSTYYESWDEWIGN